MRIDEETITPIVRQAIKRAVDDAVTRQATMLVNELCLALFGSNLEKVRVPLLAALRKAMVSASKSWLETMLSESVGMPLVECVFERCELQAMGMNSSGFDSHDDFPDEEILEDEVTPADAASVLTDKMD